LERDKGTKGQEGIKLFPITFASSKKNPLLELEADKIKN